MDKSNTPDAKIPRGRAERERVKPPLEPRRAEPPTILSFTALPEICPSRRERPRELLVPRGSKVVLRWKARDATSIQLFAVSSTGERLPIHVPESARKRSAHWRPVWEPLTYELVCGNEAGEARSERTIHVAPYAPSTKVGRLRAERRGDSMWVHYTGQKDMPPRAREREATVEAPAIDAIAFDLPAGGVPAVAQRAPSSLDEAGFFALASEASFTRGADIDAWFVAKTGTGFLDWFNAACANRGSWAGKRLTKAADVDARFLAIWDNIPIFFGAPSCSLVQFLASMSVFINEIGASLTLRSELYGTDDHPGISYLFDRIPGLKASYNKAPNLTAFECFNDPDFIAAHGHLPLGKELARTTDTRWRGAALPAGTPTTGAPEVTGFILQADFFKFRGRGLIQTTWRSNYRGIIQWVQAYSGNQATIVRHRDAWAGLPWEKVATISTTEAWDELFQESGFAVPALAVHLHDRAAGGYLAISKDLAIAKGVGPGSIFDMGRKISGSKLYAGKLLGRVREMLAALRARVA